jgi:hypothetical protein
VSKCLGERLQGAVQGDANGTFGHAQPLCDLTRARTFDGDG